MSQELKALIVFKAVDKATSIVKSVQNNLSTTMQKLEQIKWGAWAVGGATFLAMKKMVDSAASFQSSVTPLRTVVTSTFGDVEKSLEKISSAAKKWASSHTQSAEEFLKASYMMSSAGLNDIQAIEGTRKALALATATMGDATEAANLIALAYNNFGDKTLDVNTEMSRLGDVLAKTQNLFQIANLGQLSEGLKYASSTALSAKISFEEMNTVVGMLNNVGLQGSMAGTAFSNAIANLTKASKDLGFAIAKNAEGGIDFITTLENIKNATKNMSSVELMNALNKAFGQEGSRGVALLINQLDKLKDSFDQVKKASGTLQSAQKAMESDFVSQLTILGNNLKNIAITIGMPLVSALNKLLALINPVVAFVNAMMNKIPGFAQLVSILLSSITGLALALGTAAAVASLSKMKFAILFTKEFVTYAKYVKFLMGVLISGVRTFFAALGPIGWIIAAIGLIIAAVVLLWKHCKPFRVFMINTINAIAYGIGWLWGLFERVAQVVWNFFDTSFGKGVLVAMAVFMPFIGLPLLLLKNFSKIKAFFVSFWDTIKQIFRWETLFSGLKGLANAFISPINAVIQGLNTIKINIPDWIPVIGGKSFGFNIPLIPALASGGYVASSGLALVGEQGPEIVSLPRGATVYSHKESLKMERAVYHTHNIQKIEITLPNVHDVNDVVEIFRAIERYAEVSCSL
ncbi:MAG: phage tail tape measure protein [Brevinematales bacterium]|nr:phage tail tape measure protein [Brevinematales bacterium]